MKVGTSTKRFGKVVKSQLVAIVTVVEYEDSDAQHSWMRMMNSDSVEVEWDVSKPFSIRYEMDDDAGGDDDDGSNHVTAMLVNQVLSLGRLQKVIGGATDITGLGNVFVKVQHSTTQFQMTIETNLTGSAAESDDDKTVFKIYDLEENIVKGDFRDSIPTTFDFYTSATATASS